jgi:hypothetical protein
VHLLNFLALSQGYREKLPLRACPASPTQLLLEFTLRFEQKNLFRSKNGFDHLRPKAAMRPNIVNGPGPKTAIPPPEQADIMSRIPSVGPSRTNARVIG